MGSAVQLEAITMSSLSKTLFAVLAALALRRALRRLLEWSSGSKPLLLQQGFASPPWLYFKPECKHSPNPQH